ncbi:MAG TPA: two-component regulator propeller domain-containing protein, partial [Verrucomicrobiae bacterium]|nr:two-component regulator propeller domain-containing protein [Verrucomicrobiae bacterium]
MRQPEHYWTALFLFALLLKSGPCPVLSAPLESGNYKIKRWTVEDGLPQNRIACLTQTRDGYLWIGTWFGLARFDGAKFTLFNEANTPVFASDAISSLAEDSQGALWAGTENGLLRYANGSFQRFTTTDGLPHDDVWQLNPSGTNGLWLQSGNDVVRYHQNKFDVIWQAPAQARILSFCGMPDGGLDIFLNHTWVEIDRSGAVKTNYSEPDAEPLFPDGRRFWSGMVESNGMALISTRSCLKCVQNDQIKILPGRFSEGVGLLMSDHKGRIWAQTHTGHLMRYDGTNWEDFNLADAASDVICATEDAQGNVWLGTLNGLVQLRFQKVRTFTAHDGLPDDNVWAVCENAEGVWIGTDHGLANIRGNRVETVSVPVGHPRDPIRCVWPAFGGGTWGATSEGDIFKLQPGKIPVTRRVGLVTALFEDMSNRLWVATTGPVFLYQNGQWQSLPSVLKSLRNVHAILEDRAGTFWFGLKNGLARWRNNEITTFSAHDGLPEGGVWTMCGDAEGVLWIGTENGLVRFANGKFFQFNAKQNMPNGAINCILQDNAGDLWFSTLHGIYRASRADLDAVADGRSESAQPFIIGTADGMDSAESNGESQPSGWKTRDGHLWFATGKGAVVMDPIALSGGAEADPPPVVFESARADGKELFTAAEQKVGIAAGCGHSLEIQFTACDLVAPEQERFQTRLIGVDEDWSEPSASRSVNYFNLPPGDYRLEVKATDHHGMPSAPAVLDFSIAPCFWQTIWFYMLCGGGMIAAAAGVQAYRLHWQRRLLRLEQQRALANERTRIARDLHDDLGTALTGVALELDVLKRDVRGHSPVIERLSKSSQHIRHLAERMREVVWAVNPRCDNLRSLADFLEDQAERLLRAADLKARLEIPEEIPDLPVNANARHQLALAVREAFANLARHGQASQADVRLELSDGTLTICIRDNGCGFDVQSYLNKQHGLGNMRDRMEQIGGAF